MEASIGSAVLDALDSSGDAAKDTHLVTSVVELATLQVGHLETEVPDQIVVNEVGDGCGKVVGDKGGKGSALASLVQSFKLLDKFYLILLPQSNLSPIFWII